MERIDHMDLVLHEDLSTKGMVHMRYHAMVVLYFILFFTKDYCIVNFLPYIIDVGLLVEICIIDLLCLLILGLANVNIQMYKVNDMT